MNEPIMVYCKNDLLVEIEETPFSHDKMIIRTVSNYNHEIILPTEAIESMYHHLQLLKINNRK